MTITQDELQGWFGTFLPIEAVSVLFNSPPETSLDHIREQLKTMAARYTESALADVFEATIPSGLRWYRRIAWDDEVLFEWHADGLHAVATVERGSRLVSYAYMHGMRFVPGEDIHAAVDVFPADLERMLRAHVARHGVPYLIRTPCIGDKHGQ